MTRQCSHRNLGSTKRCLVIWSAAGAFGSAYQDIEGPPHLSNNLLLEPPGIHGALLQNLCKYGRGIPATSNDGALEDMFVTCDTNDVPDQPGRVNDEYLLTPRKILSSFSFNEEVTSVEVATHTPPCHQVWTRWRVPRAGQRGFGRWQGLHVLHKIRPLEGIPEPR